DTIARIDEGGKPATGTPAPPPRDEQSAPPEKNSEKKRSPVAPTKPEDLRPSVRRIVEENKLDASAIKGSARGGQITKEDAQQAAQPRGAPAAQAPAPQAPAAQPRALAPSVDFDADGTKRVAMSKIRKKIAVRLVEAQHTAAILTTFNEVDMWAIIDLRSKFKEKFEKTHVVGLGFRSIFARACVLALREFPRVNAEIDGDDVVYHNYVNLGIAVSTERGLVVPVLRNVEQMSFAKIESE